MTKANPFIAVPAAAHEALEKLFTRLYSTCEWDGDDEELLSLWREARGDAAKDNWRWWVGYADDDSYAEDADTRDEAIEIGRARYSDEGSFRIVEACTWVDLVKDGDETSEFAEQRNHEIVEVNNVGG